MLTRRTLLISTAGAAWAAGSKPRIATVITEYRRNSHADVIVGRLLEGYEYGGRRREPRVQVVTMYTDQVPQNDMSRAMAAKYNVRICPTVRGAVEGAAGVVLVGEHGKYPVNEKGQTLYPRYRLYREVVETFRATGRAVPVYCDKHFSTDWDRAKWMYDQSRELGFPLMAGSSLPVSWRRPPLELDWGAPVERAAAAFYGPKEAYGFHALEALQCMVERRKGGETGIAAVQCVEGPEVWKWTDANPPYRALLDAALDRAEGRTPGDPRAIVKKPLLFLIDYRDRLRAAVWMLDGCITNAVFAADTNGRRVSTEIWLQSGRPYSHFSPLVYYIEQMLVTGKPAYPVERTLLTTGALAALMDSSYRKGARIETPHLAVSYLAPKESLFARGPVPALEAS